MKLSKEEHKKLYGLLHQLLRARDGAWCLKCKGTEVLQVSHIYPKGTYRKMEYDPDNVKLLCVGCHLYWWHKNPIEAHVWLQRMISPKRLFRLKIRANTTDKSPIDYKLIKLMLEQEIKKYGQTSR